MDAVIHNPQRRTAVTARGQLPGGSTRGGRTDVELNDLIGRLMGGDRRGVETITGNFIPARAVIQHGSEDPGIGVIDFVRAVNRLHCRQRGDGTHPGGDLYRIGSARHRRTMQQRIHLRGTGGGEA